MNLKYFSEDVPTLSAASHLSLSLATLDRRIQCRPISTKSAPGSWHVKVTSDHMTRAQFSNLKRRLRDLETGWHFGRQMH